MTETANGTSTPALFQSQRQREIASLTLQDGRVEVAELANRFNVTTETIRRDLSELQSLGVVRRVHGGATPWETTGFEPLVSVRNDQHDDEKRRLAAVAILELPDSGSVITPRHLGATLLTLGDVDPGDWLDDPTPFGALLA